MLASDEAFDDHGKQRPMRRNKEKVPCGESVRFERKKLGYKDRCQSVLNGTPGRGRSCKTRYRRPQESRDERKEEAIGLNEGVSPSRVLQCPTPVVQRPDRNA